MKTKRVLWALGAFWLTTSVAGLAYGMESEYRPYEPATRHDHPTWPAPGGNMTQSPVIIEDSRRSVGPTFRTGDGSHPVLAPHLSHEIRPGEIPKQDVGGAGLPVWRW